MLSVALVFVFPRLMINLGGDDGLIMQLITTTKMCVRKYFFYGEREMLTHLLITVIIFKRLLDTNC